MECGQCFPSRPFVVLPVDRFVGHGGCPLERQKQDSHVYRKTGDNSARYSVSFSLSLFLFPTEEVIHMTKTPIVGGYPYCARPLFSTHESCRALTASISWPDVKIPFLNFIIKLKSTYLLFHLLKRGFRHCYNEWCKSHNALILF